MHLCCERPTYQPRLSWCATLPCWCLLTYVLTHVAEPEAGLWCCRAGQALERTFKRDMQDLLHQEVNPACRGHLWEPL